MAKFVRVVLLLSVVFLGILFGIASVLTTASKFNQDAAAYSQAGSVIYFHQIPQERQRQALSDLLEAAQQHNGFIMRADTLLEDNGNVTGFKFGFYGNTKANESAIRFEFLGNSIFNASNISTLLQAKQGATLGLDKAKSDQIMPLPSVRGDNKIVAVKLTDLVDSSGTVNGVYRIIGFNNQEFQVLVEKLASDLGVKSDSLLSARSGVDIFDPLMITIVYGLTVVVWLVLVFLSVLGAYQSMSVLGAHLLLGWSRTVYAIKVFFPIIISALLAMGLSILIGIFGLEGFIINGEVLYSNLISAIPVIGLTLLAVCIGSVSIFLVKPVNAIRNRISTRVLVIALVLMYVFASGGLVTIMYLIDGPLIRVAQLHQIQKRWEKYSNLQILYREKIGDNATSFSGQSRAHSVEYYNWYSSIAGKEGVYLVHTEYYDAQLLKTWRVERIYKNVPNHAYWQVLASPNYLAKEGIKLDPQLVDRARRGERVYLISDKLAKSDRKALEAYLTDFASEDRDSPIKTAFTAHPRFEFTSYHPGKEVFLWNTDTKLPNTVDDPVIIVSTPSNMIPFESESLWATGLEESYIKLDKNASAQYLRPGYLAKYQLDDNRPQFLPVSNFIAGLQKHLAETIQLFGSVVLIVVILGLVIVVSLVKMFSITRQEQVAVMRLLGYSLTRIFLPPIILVALTTLVCVVASLLLRSTSGVVTVLIFGLLQLVLLLYQAKRASMRGIVSLIKES